MSLGFILLIAVTLLIIFGVTQRIFDRMRLTDRQALLFVAAIFIGGLIPDIPLGGDVFINIGGAIVPLGISVYLFIKAGTTKERIRAIAAAILGGAIVFFAGWLLPHEPEQMFIDPIIVYGVLSGLAAYLIGRSRRAALIGGFMGVLLGDVAQGIVSRIQGLAVPIRLGSAGAMDAVVLSGIIAVALADVIGELREKLSKGHEEQVMTYNKGKFLPLNEIDAEVKHDDKES